VTTPAPVGHVAEQLVVTVGEARAAAGPDDNVVEIVW
jgi:hypothetical protein